VFRGREICDGEAGAVPRLLAGIAGASGAPLANADIGLRLRRRRRSRPIEKNVVTDARPCQGLLVIGLQDGISELVDVVVEPHRLYVRDNARGPTGPWHAGVTRSMG
jgi:hypothetical protein